MAEALALVSLARLQELEGLLQSQNHRPESEATERQHQVNRNQHIKKQLLAQELGREHRVSQRPDTRKQKGLGAFERGLTTRVKDMLSQMSHNNARSGKVLLTSHQKTQLHSSQEHPLAWAGALKRERGRNSRICSRPLRPSNPSVWLPQIVNIMSSFVSILCLDPAFIPYMQKNPILQGIAVDQSVLG